MVLMTSSNKINVLQVHSKSVVTIEISLYSEIFACSYILNVIGGGGSEP